MPAARRLDAITDVAGIKVGHWTDRRGATGCTVVLCEAGAVPGVDVRGGAPGTRETDLMRPGFMVNEVHGIVLTGGSTFGLASVDGVMRWCEEHGHGLAFAGRRIPLVAGAVLFDLNLGKDGVRPGAEAGYAAAGAAKSGRVQQGSVGAGTGATVAKLMGGGRSIKGGIGSASEDIGGGLIIAALAAVNAVGDIVDSRDGSVVAGPRGENGGFVDTLTALRRRAGGVAEGNTTIGVIATNARLSKEQTSRLATMGHDGLARAIRPVHTSSDGDTLFALATGKVEADPRQVFMLEVMAAVAVERAVLKGVLAATSLAGVPSVTEWRARSGA